eukprot:3634168-Amphidinium_carterae.1
MPSWPSSNWPFHYFEPQGNHCVGCSGSCCIACHRLPVDAALTRESTRLQHALITLEGGMAPNQKVLKHVEILIEFSRHAKRVMIMSMSAMNWTSRMHAFLNSLTVNKWTMLPMVKVASCLSQTWSKCSTMLMVSSPLTARHYLLLIDSF